MFGFHHVCHLLRHMLSGVLRATCQWSHAAPALQHRLQDRHLRTRHYDCRGRSRCCPVFGGAAPHAPRVKSGLPQLCVVREVEACPLQLVPQRGRPVHADTLLLRARLRAQPRTDQLQRCLRVQGAVSTPGVHSRCLCTQLRAIPADKGFYALRRPCWHCDAAPWQAHKEGAQESAAVV